MSVARPDNRQGDTPSVVVREATPDDARVTLRLMEQLLRETPFMLRMPEEQLDTVSDERRFLRGLRASGNSSAFLAFEHGEPAGLLVVTGGVLKRQRHVGHMGMGVLADHWSRGIGSALLNAAIDWLMHHPRLRKLSLQVYANNPRAVALYEQKGFRLEGRLVDEVRLDEGYVDMLQMAYLRHP